MALQYAVHERLSLKRHIEFNEAWLHDRICENTAVLGLGDLEVIERERIQSSGGRLDILLADTENDTRYEVEIMLGSTDPDHLVRCIEYWDIERRRYPAYDHAAVLVAEEVTTRFLNVIGLLAGSIPIIAIQLNAIRVGDKIVLDFVKVLDQRMLRTDDLAEAAGEDVDRSTWDSRVGEAIMQLSDRVLAMANEVASPEMFLKYKKRHIGLSTANAFFNAGYLSPKRKFLRLSLNVSNAEEWLRRFDEAGVDASSRKPGRLRLTLLSTDFEKQGPLIREVIGQAVREYQNG